jgi:acyl-CoA hydrolase
MNQTQGMTTTTPAPSGSSVGAAPMDVMTRLADHIRAKHPGIVEVRYATTPDEARRVSEIAQALQSGGPVSQHSAEIDALLAKAVPAGTTEFRPSTPPAGTRS